MSPQRLLPLLLAFGLGAGCSDDGEPPQSAPASRSDEDPTSTAHSGDDDSEPSHDDGDAGPVVTFFGSVLPVYAERCANCHQQGGIGPFRLDNYEDARTWASASLSAVEARTMPPWLATADGTCNHFEGATWLSEDEIDIVRSWVEGGLAEGEPRAIPEQPAAALDTTLTLKTPKYVPHAAGGDYARFDDYRCFVAQADGLLDRYLTSYEVRPGTPALVHHVVLMTVDPNMVVSEDGTTNQDVITALDGESPDVDGWTCFGAAGDGVAVSGTPVVWAPGQGVVHYPERTGLHLGSGELLVIQVHYNLSNPELDGVSDQTKIALHLEEEVERPGMFALPDGLLETLFEGDVAMLPPGEEDYAYTWKLPLSESLKEAGAEAFDVYGVFPHMHELGTSMSVKFTREGSADTCIADVPRWDFDWQLFYRFQQPLVATAEHTLEVTCHFDTRRREEPTLPGWGTRNEMCLAGLFVVPRQTR